MSDPILPGGEANFVENGCRSVYGRTWDGPTEKMPGPEMKKAWRDLVVKAQRPVVEALAQLQTDRTRLKAENERLRAALQPFAKTGELFPPRDPEAWDQCVYLPAAGREYALAGDHLRAARAALAQPQPEERAPLPLDPSPQGEGGGE